ncbi:hypothetical protein BS50DRAFT_627047 [Corynespora cassiicola Philippines]|uniref:Uncharacterized protein n=1 Tax=Corynespora cassiicola Philippines TaxID=1448308 RepID=A0A2T2N052_CORCC|nr:hypothetical protein BS50DRAFT_627047 [Corynespora cassiicola Philippines]
MKHSQSKIIGGTNREAVEICSFGDTLHGSNIERKRHHHGNCRDEEKRGRIIEPAVGYELTSKRRKLDADLKQQSLHNSGRVKTSSGYYESGKSGHNNENRMTYDSVWESKNGRTCILYDNMFYFNLPVEERTDGMMLGGTDDDPEGIGVFAGENHEFFCYCGGEYASISVVKFNPSEGVYENFAFANLENLDDLDDWNWDEMDGPAITHIFSCVANRKLFFYTRGKDAVELDLRSREFSLVKRRSVRKLFGRKLYPVT